MPIITFNRRGLGRLLALASGRHHGLFRNLVMRQRFGSSIIFIIESLTYHNQFLQRAQCGDKRRSNAGKTMFFRANVP